MTGSRQVRILWTQTARDSLKALPRKVRQGLLDKADQLYDCDEPKRVHKPLRGPLAHHYRITYDRYRAIYTVDESRMAGGEVQIKITIIAAGIRREHSRKDIYNVAKRLVEFGLGGAEAGLDDEQQ